MEKQVQKVLQRRIPEINNVYFLENSNGKAYGFLYQKCDFYVNYPECIADFIQYTIDAEIKLHDGASFIVVSDIAIGEQDDCYHVSFHMKPVVNSNL